MSLQLVNQNQLIVYGPSLMNGAHALKHVGVERNQEADRK